jgi:hypothetical protein
MEFGNKEDQEKVDKLMGGYSFNEELAWEIMRNFREYGIWGYQEYFNIFKAAWNVNLFLTPSAPKFRILLLSSADGYGTDKFKNKNQLMAGILEKEIISKGRKALVYTTSIHAENCLASLKSANGKIQENLKNKCLANILKEKYSDKIFSVLFHSPWAVVNNNDMKLTGVVKPLEGEIDAAIELIGKNPVAFDICESPVKDMSEKRSVYYNMNKEYAMKCVCDGYIYLRPYEEYEYVSWIPEFITEDYLKIVKAYYSKINPDLRIETVDYASDICAAYSYTLFEMVKNLKGLSFVQYSSQRPEANAN